jgi:CheY-like chemotaxis protein
MDQAQAEQILVNLAVNARDAMVQGGKLTIETANVELSDVECIRLGTESGRCVMLAVSDNGVGMSQDTQEHIFEPFFTTKEPGRGTGLGLAMVYGAVHQNKGTIEVLSDVGKGSTFRIYLPRVDERAQDVGPARELAVTTGNETIVLVEDDAAVRTLGTRVLKRQGYTVHAYGNGEEALAAIRSMQCPIDLVVTDVVMPGMDGKALSEQVKLVLPTIKVLFTSGYTRSVIADHGVLDPSIHFLAKPYSYNGLAKRVREVLDQSE